MRSVGGESGACLTKVSSATKSAKVSLIVGMTLHIPHIPCVAYQVGLAKIPKKKDTKHYKVK